MFSSNGNGPFKRRMVGTQKPPPPPARSGSMLIGGRVLDVRLSLVVSQHG